MAFSITPHRTLRRAALSLLGATALLAVSACGSDDTADDALADVDTSEVGEVVDSVVSEVDASGDELAQTLRDNGLDSIAGVVEQVDVSEWIGDGEFTFFAPDNEAFMSLDADQTADLLTNPTQILDVLRNHTLADTVTAEELTSMDSVETEAGETLEVTVDGEIVMVGGATVVTTDIEVGDGVIHVVDGLLIP